ncbi:DUF4097 family beta strand repeat-containing protein [Actinomadura rudentiformis]|uniref:DUF4097 domain-containing protein n=1 Tax=Actinomadura rudentiformis TaxID=359158 RepID=A0A6H9YHM1_9ACTN|nr:DUF4097 family beta strand repeat-containing protein [Actinomadura rudentiformis]KAB2345961.1 DUF4097 domain-containing protein [Actinomadura rudentiformis]
MKTLTGTALLAGAMVSAAALSGCGLDVDGAKHHEERSYTVTDAVTAINLDSGDGKVEVVGSDSPGIKVTERLAWSSERRKPKPEHVTEGDTLKLRTRCEGNVIGFSSCGLSYRIQVPRAMALNLHNDDGPIEVSGLRGTLRLTTDTGGITADDIQTTSLIAKTGDGPIKVSGKAVNATFTTDTGGITADDIQTTSLVAKTGDGPIKVSGKAVNATFTTDTGAISADELRADRIEARTGDGPVRLRLATPPTNVQARTDTGSVELEIPTSESYNISTTTDTGGKHIDPSVRADSTAKRKITVLTDDGPIRIRPA